MSVVVRLEEPSDRAAALEVERLAFGSDEEPGIVETVRDLEDSFALVAEEGGAVVGHVQFSRARVGETAVVALGPIAVVPERHREGIGSSLVREGLAEATRRGEIAAILIGDPAFYLRLGFEPGSAFGLANPFAGIGEGDFVIREEDLMLAALDDRARALEGPVRWHPAFGSPVEAPRAGA
jgi:putative acetyltransferase